MALLARDSGRYIKVIRERCIFMPSAVQVFYYEFDSKNDRDDYFTRKAEVEKFLELATAESLKFDIKINEIVDAALPKDEKEIQNFVLPDEATNLHREKDQFVLDLIAVESNWDNEEPLLIGLKSINKFKLLGFKEEWLTPLKPVAINGIMTGAFTNQTFSFPCLYKELKKMFKDDFIDC